MTPVFLDSSFLKGVIDNRDDFHEQAKKLWKKLFDYKTPLITSNFILDETFTLVRSRCGLAKALALRDLLSEEELHLDVIRTKVIDERSTWEWFEKDWSKLSFTDCTSFAVMKRLGLTHVATFDTHFTRAGFTIVQG